MPARHAYGCYFANKVFIGITPCQSWVRISGTSGKMPNVMVFECKVPLKFGRHTLQALICKQHIMKPKMSTCLNILLAISCGGWNGYMCLAFVWPSNLYKEWRLSSNFSTCLSHLFLSRMWSFQIKAKRETKCLIWSPCPLSFGKSA